MFYVVMGNFRFLWVKWKIVWISDLFKFLLLVFFERFSAIFGWTLHCFELEYFILEKVKFWPDSSFFNFEESCNIKFMKVFNLSFSGNASLSIDIQLAIVQFLHGFVLPFCQQILYLLQLKIFFTSMQLSYFFFYSSMRF